LVDLTGNSLPELTVNQQAMISADLKNNQYIQQPFAYLVQIQNSNGVTAYLAWMQSSLNVNQSTSTAISWLPEIPDDYTATVFVWKSIDSPIALSQPLSINFSVS